MMGKAVGRISIVLITLLIGGFGCASVPQSTQMAQLDYGQPLTSDYKAAIKIFMQMYLKDPESARYQFSQPHQGWAKEPPWAFNGPEYTGYFVLADVNAKNSFGGYTGAKPYLFVFKNNQLLKVYSPDTIAMLKIEFK
jgi:hypothetical protein